MREKSGGTASFEVLEDDVDGIIANARISFSLATIERAVEHAEWSRAFETADKLARRLADLDVSEEAWRELLVAAASFAVEADDVQSLRPTFEAFAKRAWRADGRKSMPHKSMPWQLAGVLERADRAGHLEAGRALGRIITSLFPTCPLGPQAFAHFAQRLLDESDAPSEDVSDIAAHFEQAAALADALEMDDSATRSRLRAGSLLLHTQASREHGRRLLRDIELGELERDDALTYAVGMAHSPFWLDRVRAADAVLSTASANASGRRRDPRTGSEISAPADAVAAARYLLDCAPIELQPIELDRLEALVDEVIDDEDVEGARELLALRSHLERVATAPASRAADAADILVSAFGQDASPRQRAAIEFCRLVGEAAGSSQAVALDPDSIERVTTSFPVAGATVEALAPAAKGGARRLATALGQLEGQMRQADPELTAAELAPIALLPPKLLPFLRTLDDESDVDETTIRRIVASAREILGRWIRRARTPSYGWWTLAANLLAADLVDEALLATRRAIDDGERLDEHIEEQVLAAVLDRAVRHGSDDELLEWLEIAERR
ncbi:MAG: hypothetical protein ACLFVJ_22920, partial [Persicimonas sp.]